MSRLRTFVFVSVFSIGWLLALSTSAGAATYDMPVTGLSPASGASISSTSIPQTAKLPFSFSSSIAGMTNLTVEVSKSTLPGKDGTLADDFQVGWGILYESDAFPGSYSGTAFTFGTAGLLSVPGTYYFQFHGGKLISSPPELQDFISPIYTLVVTAPTTPPQSGDPSVKVLTSAGNGRSYARKAIRAKYGSAAKISIDSCLLITPGWVECRAHWKTKKYAYRGTVKLKESASTIYYSFRGVKKKKLKK